MLGAVKNFTARFLFKINLQSLLQASHQSIFPSILNLLINMAGFACSSARMRQFGASE